MPPASFLILRCPLIDTTLGNIKVKKGTYVGTSISSLLIGKGLTDENKFYPERWLNGEMDKIDNLLKIPFSAVPKNCIG